MSKQITDYTAAVTIDGTNDYLLEYQASSGVYKKINRTVFLGITGSPLGTSDSQSVTNKTLDNTNTITLKDTLFTLQDDGDTTKQAKFQLSGITTGTTRTYTVPNASVTLASLTGTETFTNKTLTSPTITGGTIDNSTITVDSISGHTTSTIVTVGGVQMSNGLVATTGAVNTNGILAGAVVPNSLVASSGSGWSWQSWSPTWTNVTTTGATIVARYAQTGKLVTFRLIFTLGASSAIATGPTFTLPVTAASDYGTAATLQTLVMGVGVAVRQGSAVYSISAVNNSTTQVLLQAYDASVTNLKVSGITAASPATWASTDIFTITGSYEAA